MGHYIIRLLITAMAAVAILGAGSPGPAHAQQAALKPMPPDHLARARLAAVMEQLKAEGFVGVVRVDARNTTLLAGAAGLADPVARRPYAPDTPVMINSLTKPFTAAAILKLQDEGRLSVRDPISRFFPQAPADKAGITLHQLMTHTSGLPISAGGGGFADDREPLGRAAFLARLFATPLKYAPGGGFEYSNAGYSLLAAVVETVSGRAYETYLREKVLLPSDAGRTGYASAYDEATAARTRDGRTVRQSIWGEGGPYWNLLGNGGLVTTADAFVAWRKAFAGGQVVSLAAVQAAGTAWTGDDPGSGEGYGWIVANSPTRGHVELAAGGNPDFTSEMRWYRDYGLVLFVSTSGRVPAGEISGRLVRALFDEPEPQAPAGPALNPAESALVDAFLAALSNPDPAARSAFLEARVGPVFRERTGMAAITERFTQLHEALKGASVSSRGRQGPAAVVRFAPPAQLQTVRIVFGGAPDAPRLAGFEGY